MPQIRWIRTNNPQTETWRYLELFSKDSYVTPLVKNEAAKAQIVSCIQQAAEIYSVSKSASILTKPILLYYGMQRLAKALIFLKNPAVDVKNLRTHGLTGGEISEKIERFLHNKIRKTNTGIFPEFSKWSTKNNVLLKKTVYEKGDFHTREYWVYECNVPDFLTASAFNTNSLFSLIPELNDLFWNFHMTNSLVLCSYDIRQHKTGELDTLLTLSKEFDLDSFKEKFPIIKEYELLHEKHDTFTISREAKKEIEIPSPLVQAENGEIFLIAPTKDSLKISDINVHYILMFLLCHIARYKAPLWKEIVEGTKKSEYITLVKKFIEVSEIKFPKLILDEIVGAYFLYVQGYVPFL